MAAISGPNAPVVTPGTGVSGSSRSANWRRRAADRARASAAWLSGDAEPCSDAGGMPALVGGNAALGQPERLGGVSRVSSAVIGLRPSDEQWKSYGAGSEESEYDTAHAPIPCPWYPHGIPSPVVPVGVLKPPPAVEPLVKPHAAPTNSLA